MRSLFRWLTSVMFVAIVVQVGLAGYGAFHAVHDAEKAAVSKKAIESGFSAHMALGYLIVLIMLLLLLVAAIGRVGPNYLKLSGALVLLGVLQAVLGVVSESVPGVGALHTINALAIYAVSGLLAHKAWTEGRGTGAGTAAAAPGVESAA